MDRLRYRRPYTFPTLLFILVFATSLPHTRVHISSFIYG